MIGTILASTTLKLLVPQTLNRSSTLPLFLESVAQVLARCHMLTPPPHTLLRSLQIIKISIITLAFAPSFTSWSGNALQTRLC